MEVQLPAGRNTWAYGKCPSSSLQVRILFGVLIGSRHRTKRKPRTKRNESHIWDAASTLQIEIVLSSILLLLPLIVNLRPIRIYLPLWDVTPPPALGPTPPIVKRDIRTMETRGGNERPNERPEETDRKSQLFRVSKNLLLLCLLCLMCYYIICCFVNAMYVNGHN